MTDHESTTYRGIRAISRRVGVSVSTLNRWLRQGHWLEAVVREDSGRPIMDEADYVNAVRANTKPFNGGSIQPPPP